MKKAAKEGERAKWGIWGGWFRGENFKKSGKIFRKSSAGRITTYLDQGGISRD